MRGWRNWRVSRVAGPPKRVPSLSDLPLERKMPMPPSGDTAPWRDTHLGLTVPILPTKCDESSRTLTLPTRPLEIAT